MLGMFLLGNEFDADHKRANYDYYDRVTSGDSSLSACVQSIVAAEVGNEEHALARVLASLRRPPAANRAHA